MRFLLPLVAVLALPPTLASAAAPVITLPRVEAVSPTSATVSAMIDAGGLPTSVSVQWGERRMNRVLPAQDAGSAEGPVNVTQQLDGLTPGGSYVFRFVASNADGVTRGRGVRFGTYVPGSVPPVPATGAATDVTAGTATLNGTVDPRGAPVSYVFEYGTTSAYGASTPPADLDAATGPQRVSARVGGLSPATTYHVRLVANGVPGRDRTFRTAVAPAVATLAGMPASIVFGTPLVVAGQLTGARTAGVRVQLQQDPFPFDDAFTAVGDPVRTAADGSFSIPGPALTVATRLRVVTPTGGEAGGDVAEVGVRLAVSLRTSRVAGRVRFSGAVAPAQDGTASIQRRAGQGTWITVARAPLRRSGGRSSFSRLLDVRVRGVYRVRVRPSGPGLLAGWSPARAVTIA